MLVRSTYLISYQYYQKEHLRNPSDKYAVIRRNKKGFATQDSSVAFCTYTCGDMA